MRSLPREAAEGILRVNSIEGGKGIESIEREALHVKSEPREAAEGFEGVAGIEGGEGVEGIVGFANIEGVEGIQREALHVKSGAQEAAKGFIGVAGIEHFEHMTDTACLMPSFIALMRKMDAVPPTAICGIRCGFPMRESR